MTIALAAGLTACDEMERVTADLFPTTLECGPPGGEPHAALAAPDERMSLTPADVGAATARPDDLTGGWMVEVALCPDAAERLAGLTERNIGQKVALMVGEETLIEPVVRERIAGGRLVINGGYDQEQAERVAREIAGRPEP